MNTTSSDNFYLLLELFLDPPEENWAKVEARINEKKNEWNKKRNNPDGLIYQRLSERVEEMRTALSDADRRKSEGKAARTAALRLLDEQIALRAGESIAPEQVDALVKEFKNFFTEKTIRSRVKVPICDAAPTCQITASGGVSSPFDIENLKGLERANLRAAIVGKALYDGRTTLREMNVAAF